MKRVTLPLIFLNIINRTWVWNGSYVSKVSIFFSLTSKLIHLERNDVRNNEYIVNLSNFQIRLVYGKWQRHRKATSATRLFEVPAIRCQNSLPSFAAVNYENSSITRSISKNILSFTNTNVKWRTDRNETFIYAEQKFIISSEMLRQSVLLACQSPLILFKCQNIVPTPLWIVYSTELIIIYCVQSYMFIDRSQCQIGGLNMENTFNWI